MGAPIYLDYNATTPIAPEVAEAIMPCLGPLFGNPSSPHWYGIEARQAVERARSQVAAMLGCTPKEIVFTSNGTEANNMALFGIAEACAGQGRQIITSAVEHPAILEPCKELARRGYEVTIVPVDEYGLVSPADVRKALRPDTLLVSIMHANNEVGTIQPIAEIAAIAHAHGALVHTDAAQTPGKIPVNVDALGVDLLTIAGHKLYAPKGIGALYVRQGVRLAPFIRGGGQEGGRRPSTENVLGIVGLGAASALIEAHLPQYAAHLRALRDRLAAGLTPALGDLRINGHPMFCLPNTLSVGFRGLNASDLLVELSEEVAASAGAACHANLVTVSPVLQAMGVPLDYARGTLRFSVGHMTTAEEVDRAVEAIGRAVGRLRAAS
jgi:cysteine desulfurase